MSERTYRNLDLETLRQRIDAVLAGDTSRDNMDRLGEYFLRITEQANTDRIITFLRAGFPINYQSRRSGQTALHVAAAGRGRDIVRLLLRREDCDVRLTDRWGNTPADMAYLFGKDPALARLLARLARRQTTDTDPAPAGAAPADAGRRQKP